MRAFLDGAAPALLDLAAVENLLAFVIEGFKLYPNVERINGSAWEEVADFSSAHDDFDAHGFAAPRHGVDAIERRDDFGGLRYESLLRAKVHRLFADGKRACEPLVFRACYLFFNLLRRLAAHHSEYVYRHLPVAQKVLNDFHLLCVSVDVRQRGVCAGEAVRMDFAVYGRRVV